MNTLKGVFPEPSTIPKRNFIRENMIHIKRMQGININPSTVTVVKPKRKTILDINTDDPGTMKLICTTKKKIEGLNRMSKIGKTSKSISIQDTTEKSVTNKMSKTGVKESYEKQKYPSSMDKRKLREIGIQTEKNTEEIYETGIIKYPSSKVLELIARSHKSHNKLILRADSGDHKYSRTNKSSNEIEKTKSNRNDNTKHPVNNVTDDKKHESKENNQSLRNTMKQNSLSNAVESLGVPSNYQKGVIPKYLRDRKEELNMQNKQQYEQKNMLKCPEGHVILPDNERKETLRMLRQSYAELITELNQLPVRSDTLKIRNRKMEIESQLKKIDEGIKVFTRPKVYVKIGA